MKNSFFSGIVVILTYLLNGCATTPTNVSGQSPKKPDICENFNYAQPDNINDTYIDNNKLWHEFDDYYDAVKAPNGRKLIVFFDGTRNNKKDFTNIRKLYLLAIANACNDSPIIPYYDKGVDAKWFEDFEFSGPFGTGLSLNIRQAYRFLSQSFKTAPKDEIYIFGFSRGAFTARSLNGFIEFAGLLDGTNMKNDLPVGLQWVTTFENIVKSIYDTYHAEKDENELKNDIKELKAKNYPEQKFNPVIVQAIGVFDTVPAVGFKRSANPKNHQLQLYAKKGFHALSLDEQRKDFQLLPFAKPDPQKQQELSEVWFAGVHSDVGGGYSHSWNCNPGFYEGLEITPLNWMIAKFKNEHLFPDVKPFTECQDGGGKMHDEYFDSGLTYRVLSKTSARIPYDHAVIHESVIKRMKIPSLNWPHPQREPIRKYIPNNLEYPPVSCNYTVEFINPNDVKNYPEIVKCTEKTSH